MTHLVSTIWGSDESRLTELVDLHGPKTSRRGRTLSRYLSNREVSVPLVVLLLVVFFCFAGPYIFNLPGPNAGSLSQIYLPLGSHGHLFGTDADGNDLLSRLLYGGRISIEVGLGATSIGFAIGSTLGTLAGYLGGFVDSLVMRVLDILLGFPGLILALAIATYLGASVRNVIFALSFFSIPAYGRLCRANVMRLKGRDFIAAARAMGGGSWYVMRRHIPPNILPAMLTFAFMQIGIAILAEASLSYLGAGVKVPTPTWGNLISQGQSDLAQRPYLVLIPGAMLFITILSCNLLANGLRAVATGEGS
jgi:peptide/nickel transport system permease protein